MSAKTQKVPLKIVGGTSFGRYNKISVEQTYNMIVSENALVPYAGYKNVKTFVSNQETGGRGIYYSTRSQVAIVVVGGIVFRVDNNLDSVSVGSLATTTGTVFITENNNGQILLSDSVNLYIYEVVPSVFSVSNITPGFTIDFTPGAVAFQNGRFTAASLNTAVWRLSDFNDGFSWPNDSQHVGTLQTKPDTVQAAIPFPGRGNLLFLFGKNVVEQWTDIGSALFPYQRSSNFNVDFGCLNPATIAAMDSMIVWLAGNEKAGPIIMFSTGGQAQKLSNEGLDFKFSQLKEPSNSYGFLFRQDGHLIYQITFLTDNLSYIFDFSTQLFFTVTDESLGNHIARQVVFFNNKYYFVAFSNPNLYEFGTQYTSFDYGEGVTREIPRIRICPPIRMQSQDTFTVNSIGFTIEQGQTNFIEDLSAESLVAISTEDREPITEESGELITTESEAVFEPLTYFNANMAVDFYVSIDGGFTFTGGDRIPLNPTGQRQNRLISYNWGRMNDLSVQARFWGFSRFIALDGEVEIQS